MNRTDRFTAGEKALVVMLVAGVFGYWAGFKLSTPGDVAGMPVASAASLLVVAHPDRALNAPADASTAPAEQASPGSAASKNVVPRNDPPVPTF